MSPSKTGPFTTVASQIAAKSGVGGVLLVALLVFAPVSDCAADGLNGSFLVASQKLTDARFRESVILVLQHGPTGSVGLIINKPLAITLDHAFISLPAGVDGTQPLYYGGPVNPNLVWVLYSGGDNAGIDSLEIVPGVFVADAVQFAAAVKNATDVKPIRFLSGYAGWAPGQLEKELQRGDWKINPARSTDIFDGSPESLWDYLGGQGRIVI